MALEHCKHDHLAPSERMGNLIEYQGGMSRHRCAVCAYAAGLAGEGIGGLSRRCPHGKSAPLSVLSTIPTPSQAGRARHKCVICAYAAGLQDASRSAAFVPDEVDKPALFPEGGTKTVIVNAYERNPEARRRCLEHYGYSCSVCGLNLAQRYGDAGRHLIHVHHLTPVAAMKGLYHVDPVRDLRPVCPNCHSVIHRTEPPYSIDDVKAMLRPIDGIA